MRLVDLLSEKLADLSMRSALLESLCNFLRLFDARWILRSVRDRISPSVASWFWLLRFRCSLWIMSCELVPLKLFRWYRNTDWIVAFVVMLDWCVVCMTGDLLDSVVRINFLPAICSAFNLVALNCWVAFGLCGVFIVSTTWPFDVMFVLASDLSCFKLSVSFAVAKFNSFVVFGGLFSIVISSDTTTRLTFFDGLAALWLGSVAFTCHFTTDVSFFSGTFNPNGLWFGALFNGIASVDARIKWISLSMAFRLSKCERFASESLFGPVAIGMHMMNEMAKRSEHTMATRALLQSNKSWIGINLRNAIALSHHYMHTDHLMILVLWQNPTQIVHFIHWSSFSSVRQLASPFQFTRFAIASH